MIRFDHHVHTARHSPDSIIEPRDLVARARAVGLDGVVITEHDYQWEPGELADLNAMGDGLVILSGAEISTLEGHFLVYGLPDLSEAPPGIGLGELLEVVRRHDAAIVAAHPYRWEQDFDGIVAEHGAVFDAVELVSNNVTASTRRKTEDLLRRHRLAASGSSDAHEANVVGCYHSVFPGPIRTMADFVTALRSRQSRPGAAPGCPQLCGPVDA